MIELTQEHKEIINKGITKALKQVDYEALISGLLEREIDGLYESNNIGVELENLIIDDIKQKLINAEIITEG